MGALRFQLHETLRIRHADIIIGVVGHCRASPAAGLKTGAGHAGLYIQVTELGQDQRVVPHLLEGLLTNIPHKKRPLLQKGARVYVPGG